MNGTIDVKMEDAAAVDLGLAMAPAASTGASRVKAEDRHDLPPQLKTSRSSSETPVRNSTKKEKQEIVGGDITLKMEPGQAPKLSRRTSQKVPVRPAQLYDHLEDATPEATSHFEVLNACTYANKMMGYTEAPLECDCSEEWDASTHINDACGEDSDCINRLTKMECEPDCGCGNHCQNQRFQRKQWADVSVIKTDKKGYGLRANKALKPNDFIFEYIGEVIGENAFHRRMHQYDKEGIKHFYFMSLTKGEFVDATKKGNLGRFCNHSCNPNCFVDKWVVGEKLRMGIFAERKIEAGEELVFNYNVDRYGADPQPCYCGEPNCVGFIGGKTQTGGTTKLASHVVEALGLEDADDWDAAVTKKPRKRKTGEDDEEYISNVQPKELDLSAVRKVMATLSTCKEKWIAVKLLRRIQDSNDENIRFQVIRMHGYRILNNVLKTFSADANLCQQVCDILSRFPMLTRNKIHDSGIEGTMIKLSSESSDTTLQQQAKVLVDKWAQLEMGFRIRKIKRDPNAIVKEERSDRRDGRARSKSKSKSPEPIKAPSAPTGPRSAGPHRPAFARPPPPFRPRPTALPEGWFQAVAANGNTYYYNATGTTTWQRPTIPALAAPPPPPPKAVSDQEMLQNLINSIISKKDDEKPADQSGTQMPAVKTSEAKREKKEDRWKSYSEEKRKKLYENTLFPHISYVMNKYKKHIPRDDLKKLGKQIAKKLVDSDFKKGRVTDPRKKLDAKQEKVVKQFVRDFFDRAYQKQKERKKSEAKSNHKDVAAVDTKMAETTPVKGTPDADGAEDDMQLSENEVDDDEEDGDPSLATPAISDSGAKRPREDELGDNDDDLKRARIEAAQAAFAPPPPPPPPPPAADMKGSSAEVMQLDTPSEAGVAVNGHSLGDVGHTPMQIATPPTTGSPDHDVQDLKDG